MYEVLIPFVDGENGIPWSGEKGGFSYSVGDKYPKAGFEPSKKHIAYLIGKANAFGKPVIKEIKPPKQETKKNDEGRE